jgi:enoyl-CoA hydratase/carnithine racemase
MQEIAADKDARAVVLTGAGKYVFVFVFLML